jgi:hypothetical protein
MREEIVRNLGKKGHDPRVYGSSGSRLS